MLARSIFGSAVFVALLLDVSTALGAPHDPRPSGIALRTDGAAELDEPGLRLALQSTLGVAVSEPRRERGEDLATVVVRRHSSGSVTIVFVRPDGREVERTLDLPADRGLATETIALAAGNLVRDEAAELVAALAPPPPPAPAAIAPTEAPPEADVPPAKAPAGHPISCTDGDP